MNRTVRRHIVNGFAALAGSASMLPAISDAQAISVSEASDGDAMTLADRILPADIRAVVVQGTIRRQFLPGQVFWAGYLTKPRPVGSDLCARTEYSVQLRSDTSASVSSDSNTSLKGGPVERTELQAVAYPAASATDRSCARTAGFVKVDGADKERKVAAYRFLIEAMRKAQTRRPLPFALSCQPMEDLSCKNVRASLADLPLDALYHIDVDSLQSDVTSEAGGVRIITRRPVQSGQPFGVTFAFGMSGEDGKSWSVSWKVSWKEGQQPPAELTLERLSVLYH